MKLFSFKKKPAAGQKSPALFRQQWSAWKRRLLRPEVVLWFLWACVACAELYAIYASVYQNLVVAETPAETSKRTSVVRINLDQYQQVVRRLDGISLFRPSPNIDFTGSTPNIGRSNPFADPE